MLAVMAMAIGADAFGDTYNTYNKYKTVNKSYTYVSNYEVVGLTKLRVSSSAMDSVELNPDHEGFSISAGIASYSGEVAGAVGAMYSWQYEETSFIQNLGINVKAYNGEAGYNGGSAGVTLGF